MKRVYGIFVFELFCSALQAQIFYSNGATIHINTAATVITNGGVEIANSSGFTNDGTLTVTKNSVTPFPGNFTLNSGSTVDGNGVYRVEQDWINDATFNGGTSTVELFGNTQQFITSTTATATAFNNLQLTGSGIGTNRKKTLQGVNASTSAGGILTLADRELETQTNTFFVLNTATGAVVNTTTPGFEGFVSSLSPGFLSRQTNSSAVYLFPTGSSLGTLRYRPIEITPNASAANTYTVRLNNNDATVDGFDRNLNDSLECTLNDLYYHSIERPVGSTSADIKMFYDPAADGTWQGMAHWKNASGDWNDMGTTTAGISASFSTLQRPTWLFATAGHPYVLTNVRPATPVITCPTICENTPGNIFTLTGSSGSYTWTVPGSGTIVSGQGTSSISVDWTTGTGAVTVIANGVAGCNSLPGTCTPTVLIPPVAGFSVSPDGTFGDSWQFTDTSAGATSWSWAFGDGNTTTVQNPLYQYSDAGSYTIILTASNGACSDTASITIEANGGIIVPNIFSPNGDGINDGWYVMTGKLSEYSLSIYDRWGMIMFASDDITQKWDGNYKSKECVEGTYYYVLKAKTQAKDYSQTGALLLVRK